MAIDIDEEEWAVAANEIGEVLTFHRPCEVYFNWGLGPESDGDVPIRFILDEMAKHEEACNGVDSGD